MSAGQATTTSDIDRAASYLAKVPTPANGSRNDTLNQTAFMLMERFNLPESDLTSLLTDWAAGFNPPLPDTEVATTIASALTGGRTKGVAGSKARPQSGRSRHTPPTSPTPPRANQTPPQAPSVSYDLSGAPPLPPPIENSTVQLLQSLFQEGEGIRIAPAELNDDGKEVPDGGGVTFTREEWLKRLGERGGKINNIFSSTDRTGIYIGVNPYTPGKTKDSDVTSFRHALVEFDEGLSQAEQFALYQQSKLPVAAVIDSGGKSVHAWVRVDAKDRTEYDERVSLLYGHFQAAGYVVDVANKNPGRLSRLPGCIRFKRRQELLSLRAGCESWQEWTQHIGVTGEAADGWAALVTDGASMCKQTLAPQVVIVEGIICEKSKLLIGAGSKSYKTWLTIHLATCIATGTPFLGRKCLRRRVLYVNLELKPDTFIRRLQAITPALGVELDPEWFHHLPLRGEMAGIPPAEFVTRIIQIAKAKGCEVVVVDPLYKLNAGGDENSAGDQTLLFNELDRLTTDADATVILNDHFGKGNQSEKDPLDAVRGSSAKGGDVDAAMILRKHDVADSFRVDMVHRELAGVDPFVIAWEYPMMRIREDLDPAKMKQAKGGKKGQDPLKLLALIRETTIEAGVSISAWAKRANIDRATLKVYTPQMRLDGWIATTGEGNSACQFITQKGMELLK